MRGSTYLVAAFVGIAATSHAQWLNYPDPRTPRTADGRPNLTAPAPRAADGKPDLSGVWKVDPTPVAELTRIFKVDFATFDVPGDDAGSISKYFVDLLVDQKPEESPMRPEAQRLLSRRSPAAMPDTSCLPPGSARGALIPVPFKMIQTPGLILVAYESPNPLRQIHTDGRKQSPDPEPSWMGYSVGTWDADRLVVETIGFNDKTWLDAVGHPHSEKLRLTERYRRRDFGHMDVEMTVDDPVMYTRAFTVKFGLTLLPDTDIIEFICVENEKDRVHIK